jgi:protein-tyrosine phosphatase
MTTGRIDVHSHLLPNVDDGCSTLAESLECARRMVMAGYTHSFCTPHYWPNLPTSATNVRKWTAELQNALDSWQIPLKLLPGGEINLRPDTSEDNPAEIVSYGMARKYALIDLWADVLPAFFEPQLKWLQSLGMTVILAHPERMKAVQSKPQLADHFAELGVLLQGNLQCFSDPPGSPTRVTAERYLREDRYFMLGSDLHNLRTLDARLEGLKRTFELAGETKVNELTVNNPRSLMST